MSKAVKGFGFKKVVAVGLVGLVSIGLVGCGTSLEEAPKKESASKQSQEVKEDTRSKEEINKDREETAKETREKAIEEASKKGEEAKKVEEERQAKIKEQQDAVMKASEETDKKGEQKQEDVKVNAIEESLPLQHKIPLEQYKKAMEEHYNKVDTIIDYIEDELTRKDINDKTWRQGMLLNTNSLQREVLNIPKVGVAEGYENDYKSYYNVMEKIYNASQLLSEGIGGVNEGTMEKGIQQFHQAVSAYQQNSY